MGRRRVPESGSDHIPTQISKAGIGQGRTVYHGASNAISSEVPKYIYWRKHLEGFILSLGPDEFVDSFARINILKASSSFKQNDPTKARERIPSEK